MTDFSQSGEEEVILDWAKRFGPGRFLDLGAGDGKSYSNTHALFLAGWSGVVVEASPWGVDHLSALYADTPVEVVGGLVTTYERGLMDFYYVAGDFISSTDSAHTVKWTEDFKRITLAAVTLGDILERYGGFDFVNIDTEGSSVDLLNVYAQHELWSRSVCFCVEYQNEGEKGEIQEFCAGWKTLAITANNVIMAR